MRLDLQVVDVVSTWRSLGPELSCDSRPLVVKGVAELLALVPQLTVKSEEYEVARRHGSSPPVVVKHSKNQRNLDVKASDKSFRFCFLHI